MNGAQALRSGGFSTDGLGKGTSGLLFGTGEFPPVCYAGPGLGEPAAESRVSSRFGSPLNGQPLGPALRALAEAINAKDNYTGGHSRRVGSYAGAIAKRIGRSQTEVRETELAGELHDIGKIGVPEHILQKAGRLTEQEYHIVSTHTVIGERILAHLFGHKSVVASVARSHHERWDGTGGPDGLSGEEIPLQARIVAVADSFDAMTTSRPYRTQLPHHVALMELDTHAGTQFDPECVSAFLRLVYKPGRRGRELDTRHFTVPQRPIQQPARRDK